MKEMVQVLRAEDYFQTFGVNGIGKGAKKELVKKQLIDSFRKEIFGIVAMRAKKSFDEIPKEGDPEAIRIVQNVIHDETRKWIKLCDMFARYVETQGVIAYDDLSKEFDTNESSEGAKDERT